jgi:predicted dehydrogenase/threonine dehydrogenase-like Zn-dependent dehydrogenase
MKQVVQNYRSGELAMLEVPVPACQAGGVVVRTRFSLVSTGTESMKIEESRRSLLGKARARPDQVRQVVHSVSQQGLLPTYRKVSSRLDSYTPLGYSLCGEVVEVGVGVHDLRVGDVVACAGNAYALHAELNFVPRNLCVPVPPGVMDAHAAFTTVGAVAMQGYRQSEARLGEVAVVIGLGLVGQLLVQLLGAAGAQVLGIDPSESRCRLAEQTGALRCGPPSGGGLDGLIAHLAEVTGGAGADHVFLTAGGSTNQPVELAAQLARDRARVVDIGKTRLDLPWKEYYEKELDVRFSRSYGPGRYDPVYEEMGVDYPIGYVRWTEQRNMSCFLELLAKGSVDVAPLVDQVVDFDQAVQAYERLMSGEQTGVGLLFRYRQDASLARHVTGPGRPRAAATPRPVVRLGVIGAGNYATSMLLPHLRGRDDVRLVEVATSTSLSAANALRTFGFDRCSTDYQGLLADDTIDAVLIATRHHAHAQMAADALRAGKAVFVEKPLAISVEDLDVVIDAIDETGSDRLMVGFNRRFAPLLNSAMATWGKRTGPITMRYDVNAGALSPGSWYARPEEGSRIVGECGHFIDTASWWIGSEPIEVYAAATSADPDDAAITIRYEEGSVLSLGYQTTGEARYPKEVLQVFGGGQVLKMHNFQRVEHWRHGRRTVVRNRRGIDKGQRAELSAFVDSVLSGDPMPISLKSLVATTCATLAAHRSILSGRPEPARQVSDARDDHAPVVPAKGASA